MKFIFLLVAIFAADSILANAGFRKDGQKKVSQATYEAVYQTATTTPIFKSATLGMQQNPEFSKLAEKDPELAASIVAKLLKPSQ